MDKFIAKFPGEVDADLMLCRSHGVAYQIDQTNLVTYDAAYYAKCASYEGQEIANKINAGRMALVDRFVGPGAVIDVGIGSGEFIKTRPNTFGHDVNPVAIEWLKRNDLWAQKIEASGVCFWDVIEHVPDPGVYLKDIPLHGFAFFSLPIFYGLGGIRTSKHYRPGEHLYYWTEDGFADWMALYGFGRVAVEDFEMEAGRESIHSYAFRRFVSPAAARVPV